ncbi:extra spindle pole bodies 1 [Perkinsus olseni]|uniref:separase n=1 Tax=Perkinsus olseni TaxID=32597 RepID=A0A7J6LGB2_PEROL|nr:extra spindle pole bodies 1 [Perkinsus olseni]
MGDGSPTIVDKLTELSRTHHGQQLEELLQAIIKDLPAGSLSSKSRRAVCKAVQLKPQGLRLRLRSLASGKTENEVMPALPGSLLGARIARLVGGSHGTDLACLAAVVAGPLREESEDKDEIFTTLSLLMSEDLVASPSSDNIMTNVIRLRTVARSATGDVAVRALQRPIRELLLLLLHEEVVVDMAMYDSCKLLAYMPLDFLLASIDDSTLSDRIRIVLCSILLSKAAAAAQPEFETSRVRSVLIPLLGELTGVDATMARDIELLDSRRIAAVGCCNLSKLIFHLALPHYTVYEDIVQIQAACIVLIGSSESPFLRVLKSSLYHDIRSHGDSLSDDLWLPHITDFASNLWTSTSVQDLSNNVLDVLDDEGWKRPRLLLAVLEWLHCKGLAAVLRAALGLRLLRLLHWPPADEKLFTSGPDAISRHLFDEESDCGGSGAWRVVTAYRAALLTGIAHDEMGSKRGALFFYRKSTACSNEVIRTVADEFARSITEEADKGIPEYPWLKRDHPTLEREIHRAECLHSDRCDARPARAVCGACLESLLRVGDAEGHSQPRPSVITERQWQNRQYKECCPYIEKTARLVEIARSCLNRAVVDAENAWLSRRSGKLLLTLLGDLLLCKVPKKERVRFYPLHDAADWRLLSVSWSSRAALFMLSEYRCSERASDNDLPAFIRHRLQRREFLRSLCESSWPHDVDSRCRPACFNAVFVEQDHLGKFWMLRRFPWGLCFLAPLPSPPESVLRAAAGFDGVIADNIADVRLAVESKQDGQKFWRNREDYERRAQKALQRLKKVLFGDWSALLLAEEGGCTSPEADLKLLDSLPEPLARRKATQAIRAVLEFDAIKERSLKSASGSRPSPLYLFLAPCLMNLPIEFMFTGEHPVVRGGSINLLLSDVTEARPAQGNGGYYVLDPSGDLNKSNKKLEPLLANDFWKGQAGAEPPVEDVIAALATRQVFLYVGHSGGGQYWSTSGMEKRALRADALLMGCASVRSPDIEALNSRFEAAPPAHHYLVGGSARVVGTLWEVLGRECDLFSMEILRTWCITSNERDKDVSRLTDLPTSARRARSKVKLELLSGGAFVCYASRII